jgi:hypothetical protein
MDQNLPLSVLGVAPDLGADFPGRFRAFTSECSTKHPFDTLHFASLSQARFERTDEEYSDVCNK